MSVQLLYGNHDDRTIKKMMHHFQKINLWRIFKEFDFTCTHSHGRSHRICKEDQRRTMNFRVYPVAGYPMDDALTLVLFPEELPEHGIAAIFYGGRATTDEVSRLLDWSFQDLVIETEAEGAIKTDIMH